MWEQDFRATLTPEELEKRGLILPFKIYDITIFEKICKYSDEWEQTFDVIINTALKRLLRDVEEIWALRS